MPDVITTDVESAVDKIAHSHLCAIPTETVYGLGANAADASAVARVFEAKDRPIDHPLIVHVADFQTAMLWLQDLPRWAQNLAQHFWPGPLTIVGHRTALASDHITAGQNTVAVRVPNHSLVQQVLSQLQQHGINGLVAPSANKFGHVSPTTAQHVSDDLGDYLESHGDAILDGGPSEVGIESTLVLATGNIPVILRPGAIGVNDIEKITGLVPQANHSESIKISGNLASHYSPMAQVEIITSTDSIGDMKPAGLIALDDIETPAHLVRLAAPATSIEFAADLYSAMRNADALGLSHIYVVIPEGDAMSDALMDRVSRAAHSESGD